MAPLAILSVISLSFSWAYASPPWSRQTDTATSEACAELHQRKAWHNLSDDEKAAYIQAELCLMRTPPKTGHPLVQNRWDEFTVAHEVQTQWVHDVGHFLPWHRYIVLAHENALRDECNYQGYQPYWEETRDMDDLASSVLFDPTTGFGGQGGDCIDDGPFANLTIHLSYNYTSLEFYTDDRCISRSFNTTSFQIGDQAAIDKCFAYDDAPTALDCYFGGPHGGGHLGVGGTMANVAASIGDPLFFLHHTNLDRLWWDWQRADTDSRIYAIGPLRNQPTEAWLERTPPILPPPGPEFVDYSGDNGNVTTLNHVIWMAGLVPNITLADIMDLSNTLNCAEYV